MPACGFMARWGPMNAGSYNPGRRGFFRESLGRIAGPVADLIESHLRPGSAQPYLRPPGALPEERFLDVCRRCGDCARVCPARAISLTSIVSGPAAGTPAIHPELAACVVCDGLLCTQACPSGALRPLEDPRQIRMGVARVRVDLCVRSAGEPCTLCVERCPIGTDALDFDDDGPPVVREAGCVGCGVCQLYCPTRPRAIVVLPVRAADGLQGPPSEATLA